MIKRYTNLHLLYFISGFVDDVIFSDNGLYGAWLKPRLHDTTCCQTGFTTGCIVYTNIQPVVKPADNRFHNLLYRVHTAGCQTGCTTRFDNWLNEQWLFVQHGLTTGCIV